MWLMASKGRPQAAKQVLDECWQTGMRQKAVLFVDGDPTGYDFTRPDNWAIHYGSGNLSAAYQYGFTAYPGERAYGWMADDNHPVTEYWSYIIEDVCGGWHLVHCRDEWVSNFEERQRDYLYRTKNLGGGICWGGDLMRSVGYWSPPGIVQGGIDYFWTSLCGDTPLGIYLHNVTVRHDNWNTGRRAKDNTDVFGPHVQKDVDHMRKYLESGDFMKLKERVLHEYRVSTMAG